MNASPVGDTNGPSATRTSVDSQIDEAFGRKGTIASATFWVAALSLPEHVVIVYFRRASRS